LKHKTVVMLTVATLVAGCANMNISKEMQGTVAGVTAGAVAGAQVGGVRGAIIGGVIGGVVGNRIGARLDEQDKKKLAELEERALQTGKSGSFVSNKSQDKVSVMPQRAVTEADPERNLTLPADVAKQSLEVAAVEKDKVVAFVDTPIYGDISEKYEPKRVIKKGEAVNVVANVAKKQWGVVAEGGSIVGYVPLRYLDKSIEKNAAKPFAKAAPPKPKAPKTIVAKSDKSGAKGAASTQTAVVQPASIVQVVRVCKVNIVKLEPTDGGKPIQEERKYCSDPPPKWRLVGA
jgi:surface antigen